MTDSGVMKRMQELIEQWERESDQRSIFLSCYTMMTANMLAAVESKDFKDPPWVEALLLNFAEYYFNALQAYDQDPLSAPLVWQAAHNYTRDADAWALQKLLLGVNAHINFDLVLTLGEMLGTEWELLSEDERAARYWDYCYVNDIIGQTIDAVQDQVLEPAMPWMELVDKVLGNHDERLISHLLSGWRDKVWEQAMNLLAATESGEQIKLIEQVEADALRLAQGIMRSDLSTWFD